MKISVDKLWAFCGALPVFILSILVMPYATVGDQQFYRVFYEGINGLSLLQAFDYYQNMLGTSEPGYFLFVYSVADFLNKDWVFSFINFLVFYYLLVWMRAHNVSRLATLLLYGNFYIFVLFFSAERLKFAIFVFLFGYSLRGLARYLFYGLSLITHVQFILLLVGTQVRRALAEIRGLARGEVGLSLLSFLFVLVSMSLLLFFLRDHIASKLSHYYGAWGGASAILKPLVFTCMAIFYAPGRRFEAFLVSLPMLLASFFIGSERVVIFSYFAFMYYGLRYRNGFNLGVMAAGVFFFYKGILFVSKIIEFGDGFAGIY
jgi:hypothetical protein